MITKLISSLPVAGRALTRATRAAALASVAGLAALSSARASVPSVTTNGVVVGDTYSIELVGYNQAAPSGDFYAIQPGLQPTFGTTQTYANDALGGQTLTVTSSQTGSGTNFTDTITISVPTNFIPAGTVDSNGAVVNSLEFSIGTYLGGTNTLDFNTSLNGATYSGSLSGTNIASPYSLASGQNPVVTNGGMSLSNAESFTSTPTSRAITEYGINSVTFTISVPEPSTDAAVLLGAAGLCWLTVVRRRARA